MYFNTIKAINDKFMANITANSKKSEVFPLTWETRQGYPLLPLLFSTVLKIPARKIRQEKKKEVKLSVSADDMIVHTENPKDSTEKLSEITYNSVKL